MNMLTQLKMEKSEILKKIIEIYKAIIDKDIHEPIIEPSTKIKEELGLNSVGLLYIIVAIEEQFDVVLHDQSIEKFITIGDVIDYIYDNI